MISERHTARPDSVSILGEFSFEFVSILIVPFTDDVNLPLPECNANLRVRLE